MRKLCIKIKKNCMAAHKHGKAFCKDPCAFICGETIPSDFRPLTDTLWIENYILPMLAGDDAPVFDGKVPACECLFASFHLHHVSSGRQFTVALLRRGSQWPRPWTRLWLNTRSS